MVALLAGESLALRDGDDTCGGVSHPSGAGFWLLGGDGQVIAYGKAPVLDRFPKGTYTDWASTSTGEGLWAVSPKGEVFAVGDARPFDPFADGAGDPGIRGLISTPSDDGLWGFDADGGVWITGEAPDLGQFPKDAAPFAAMAATPTGQGLWAVNTKGEVFTLGDARPFDPFAEGDKEDRPPCCRGLVATPSGEGLFWLLSDGRVLTVGDAPDLGNFPESKGRWEDLAVTPSGGGLWAVALDNYEAIGDAVVYPPADAAQKDPTTDALPGTEGVERLPGILWLLLAVGTALGVAVALWAVFRRRRRRPSG